MTFGTVILCNVTKKMVEKNFRNCSYSDGDVTNYVNFFEKLFENMFFSQINLVTDRKKILKFFFQLFKVKIS